MCTRAGEEQRELSFSPSECLVIESSETDSKELYKFVTDKRELGERESSSSGFGGWYFEKTACCLSPVLGKTRYVKRLIRKEKKSGDHSGRKDCPGISGLNTISISQHVSFFHARTSLLEQEPLFAK